MRGRSVGETQVRTGETTGRTTGEEGNRGSDGGSETGRPKSEVSVRTRVEQERVSLQVGTGMNSNHYLRVFSSNNINHGIKMVILCRIIVTQNQLINTQSQVN